MRLPLPLLVFVLIAVGRLGSAQAFDYARDYELAFLEARMLNLPVVVVREEASGEPSELLHQALAKDRALQRLIKDGAVAILVFDGLEEAIKIESPRTAIKTTTKGRFMVLWPELTPEQLAATSRAARHHFDQPGAALALVDPFSGKVTDRIEAAADMKEAVSALRQRQGDMARERFPALRRKALDDVLSQLEVAREAREKNDWDGAATAIRSLRKMDRKWPEELRERVNQIEAAAHSAAWDELEAIKNDVLGKDPTGGRKKLQDFLGRCGKVRRTKLQEVADLASGLSRSR